MLDGINRGGGGKFGVVVRRGEPTLAEANGENMLSDEAPYFANLRAI